MSDEDPFDIKRFDESYPPSAYAPPPPGTAPTITTLAPATSVVGVLVTVTVTGTNFVSGSVIQSDGAALPTTFVSATSLTVTGTPLVDGTSQVTVRNPDAQVSNAMTYTVTTVVGLAADEEMMSDEEAPES